MKLPLSFRNRNGSTLVVVLILCSITLLILGSALQWSTTNVTLSERNNEYYRTVAVAEAATEKVISRLVADYKTGGEVTVRSTDYSGVVPTASENARFGNYQFSDGDGHTNSTLVRYMPTATPYRLLTGRYKNLYGYATPFRVISNARQLDSLFKVTAAVAQDFEVTTIPLFQFAIFYNIDLEIMPGPDMVITGPVFSNEDIYVAPGATLTFEHDVMSAGTIYEHRKDNNNPPGGTIDWAPGDDGGTSGASSLNLPIGTNNNPAAVREVVEVPPGGESATSDMGKERFYNKADMIIKIDSGGNITVTSGRVNNFATTIPRRQWDWQSNAVNGNIGFIRTNVSFFNKRENKTVVPIQIDIGKLNLWNSYSTNLLRPLLTNNAAAGNIMIVYAVDQRVHPATTESGVRLFNGQTLLPKGLTVATPNPAYIWGHYNVTNSALGTTNTTQTKPAAVIGDAITILSPNWSDVLSTLALGSRSAIDTTVNAAFLAGIVETTNGVYSGGVENYPRFLENWSGDTFTYNGSMVVMYPSKYAIGQWGGTGTGFGIYNPPVRKWAFDGNFRDVAKLPPGTPMLRGIVRGTWAMIQPNTTNVVASP